MKKKPDRKKSDKDTEKVSFDELVGALLEVPHKAASEKRKPSKKDA